MRSRLIPMAGGGYSLEVDTRRWELRADIEDWGVCFVWGKRGGARLYWSPNDTARELYARAARRLGGHACDGCGAVRWGRWDAARDAGWRSHTGHGPDGIVVVCPSCSSEGA